MTQHNKLVAPILGIIGILNLAGDSMIEVIEYRLNIFTLIYVPILPCVYYLDKSYSNKLDKYLRNW